VSSHLRRLPSPARASCVSTMMSGEVGYQADLHLDCWLSITFSSKWVFISNPAGVIVLLWSLAA
jgi:hypothetical protein